MNLILENRLLQQGVAKVMVSKCLQVLKLNSLKHGIRVPMIHISFLFKAFKAALKVKKRLNSLYSQIQDRLQTSLLQRSLEIWSESLLTIYRQREHERRADDHRKQLQMHRVIRGLLLNLHFKNLAQSQLKMSINSRLSSLILKAFQGWRFVSITNRRQRDSSFNFRAKFEKSQKSQYFYEWIQQALSHQRADTFRCV